MPQYKAEIISTIKETVYLEADNPDEAQLLLGEGYQPDKTENISIGSIKIIGLDITITEKKENE